MISIHLACFGKQTPPGRDVRRINGHVVVRACIRCSIIIRVCWLSV